MKAPESKVLFTILQAIATIRERKELFATIFEKIKPVIPVDDTGILILDKTGKYWQDWSTVDNYQETEGNIKLRQLGYNEFLPVDRFIEYSLNRTDIMSVAQFKEHYPEHPFGPVMWEVGLREFIFTPLIHGGRKLGVLFFDAEKEGTYREEHIPLFKAIANQLSVAVANILAHEEILEREQEKATLLSISEQLATIHDKHDLFRVIFEKLKPVFKFDDAVVVLYYAQSQSTRHYTHVHAVDINRTLAEGYQQILTEKIPVAGTPYQEMVSMEEPRITTMAYLLEHYPDHIGVQTANTFGLVEHVFMPLRYSGQLLGFLEFHAKTKDLFPHNQIPLFRNVSDQVAVALANILANEEILEREREKEKLLQISEAVATIRSRQELLGVIYDNIRSLLPFYGSGLFVVNEAENYHQLLIDPQTIAIDAAHLGPPDKIPFRGSVAEFMASQVGVTLTQELISRFPGHPHYQHIQQAGVEEFIYGPLNNGGKLIGMLCFSVRQSGYYKDQHLRLFKALSDQIAVAVANILANEEILEREREKALLLSISGDISSARNAVELLSVIREKAQKLIPFVDTGVLIVEPGGQHHYDLAVNIGGWDDSEANLHLRNEGLLRIIHPGSYVDHVMQLLAEAGGPLIEDWEARFEVFDYPFFHIGRKLGYKESLVTKLKWGGRVLGTFWLNATQRNHFHTRQFEIFQALADQVAVAVANILANEEIQEREREKALQLSLINALTAEREWEKKLLKALQALQAHIPFDYAIVGIEKNEQTIMGFSFRRIGFEEYQTILAEDFFRMTGLTPEKYATMRAEIKHESPLLLNGGDFEDYCRRSSLKRLIAGTFDLQSNLMLPLPLTRDGRFIISLFSKHPHTYQQQHLDLLLGMQDSLSMTLDKLLAYEEIEKLSEKLQQENTYLLEEVKTNYNFEEIIGTSTAIREVLAKVMQVAPVESTVLIEGETGTGKELIARAIHNLSGRRSKLLVKLNCACLPAQLIESELFGHEKGAFTGAIERRIGKFELANGGTIFLDEIGEMPLELQAKLLRVLQEREVERLGGKGPIKCDVRVIAATNRNLQQEVAQGKFRADLYFRLNVFPITLPPLRERREDIPLLASFFLKKCSKKMGKNIAGIAHDALQQLMIYNWPGNIRELEHIIEQSVITSGGKTLSLARPLNTRDNTIFALANRQDSIFKSLADQERDYILKVLKVTNGRIRGVGGAAEILNINPTTLESRMKKLGIRKEHVVAVKV